MSNSEVDRCRADQRRYVTAWPDASTTRSEQRSRCELQDPGGVETRNSRTSSSVKIGAVPALPKHLVSRVANKWRTKPYCRIELF